MERVVRRVTKHYKDDFTYDKSRLADALRSPRQDERTFYWMARPCGTWLVSERNVFFKDSDEYRIWTHYIDSAEGIEAFRIVVTDVKDYRVIGSVQPIDYAEQVKRIIQVAIPPKLIQLWFANGEHVEGTHEYLKAHREQTFWDHGVSVKTCYIPESEEELAAIIAKEHRQQNKHKPLRKKSTPRHGER